MQYQTATRTGAFATEQNKVLRNTYMMLALTMIPTIIGAFVGMGVLTFSAGLFYAWPVAVVACLLLAAIGAAHAGHDRIPLEGVGTALLILFGNGVVAIRPRVRPGFSGSLRPPAPAPSPRWASPGRSTRRSPRPPRRPAA